MKKLQVEVDGKIYDIFAEHLRGETWVHFDGEILSEKGKKGGSRHRSSATGAESGDLLAPMPGKITQIRVRSGETVKTGQVLVVMEAMKMEYTLKSATDGVVDKIACEVGNQVAVDQLLVSVQSKKSP